MLHVNAVHIGILTSLIDGDWLLGDGVRYIARAPGNRHGGWMHSRRAAMRVSRVLYQMPEELVVAALRGTLS
jgi:hypothetical protein